MKKPEDKRARSTAVRSGIVKSRAVKSGVVRSGAVRSGVVKSGRFQNADPRRSFAAINAFLLKHDLRIAGNPCVSPDFCLDWSALKPKLAAGKGIERWPKSQFETAA